MRRFRFLDPFSRNKPRGRFPLPTPRRYDPWIPAPEPQTPKEDEEQDVLKVEKVDLKIKENGSEHHTDKYELMRREVDPHLVIRRGQNFQIDFTFNRPFDKDIDGVSFVFSVYDGKPSMGRGTLVVVPLLDENYGKKSWSAYAEDVNGKVLTVQFKTPAYCSVGRWKFSIDTKLKSSYDAISYIFDKPIYILFNPWNEADNVYLEGNDLCQEYVMEETGLIWRGSHNRLRPTPWAYSQFEKDVLDCALLLLSEIGKLSPSARSDSVKIARAISALVNSPDDDGVLEGNWTEDFTGGTPPTKWTGSLKILQKYFDTRKPVKFGQCWIFAGVITTICRTLGIPSRPVTNYSSAHDTQSSMTVDYFLDKEGKAIEELNTDSVWNFHVWNEVWMKRPDLDPNDESICGGWQVIDGTPQEKSDEMFQCGPASVSATKRGEIRRPFDSMFLFSEVNADKVYWRYRGPSRPLKLLGKKPEAIGLLMSTKAVGSFEREDITETYKYPENSNEERETMLAALKQSESMFSRYYLNEDFNDVRFDFELIDDIVIGSHFRVLLRITNVSPDMSFDVNVTLRVDTMFYNGKIKEIVKKEAYDINIQPESEEELTLEISYDDYSSSISDQCAFNVACFAKVLETNFEYFAQDDFRVRKPDIKFDIFNEDEICVNGELNGMIMLTNPLPTSLTGCQFIIDAPGMGGPFKIRLPNEVGPFETAEAEFQLIPMTDGEKTISAKFTSIPLEDVDGFITVIVNPSNEIDNFV